MWIQVLSLHGVGFRVSQFLSFDLLVKATVTLSEIMNVKPSAYHTGGQPS